MLIPTDFFHLSQGRPVLPDSPIIPWTVLSYRTYRLDLVLFYDTGIWRSLSVYFNMDKGYRFHSSLYLNNTPPTDKPPSLISRSQWEERGLSIGLGGIIRGELVRDNDPEMIGWLLEHDIIHSVPPKLDGSRPDELVFLSSLNEIWSLHKDKSPLAQHNAANLMALLGDHVAQYFSVIKITEEAAIPCFPVPASTGQVFFPNMDLGWKQWGANYLMHHAFFPDSEGKDCSAYLGYVGGEDPWWRILYINCNQKVTACDDLAAVLPWLHRHGIVTDKRQEISWSNGADPGFTGAVRGGIHPHFFEAAGALKHLDFRRF